MRYQITIFIILAINWLQAQSQHQRLRTLGFSQSDIELSECLPGENGKNNVLLIVKSEDTSANPNFKLMEYSYFLLHPNNRLIEISHLKSRMFRSDVHIMYFDMLDTTIFVITREIIGMRIGFNIYQFNLSTGAQTFGMQGEQPCSYNDNCTWINYVSKKLAIFSNNIVYSYDWEVNQLSKIAEVLNHSIDAVTGRNMNLRSVTYNELIGEFEYGR